MADATLTPQTPTKTPTKKLFKPSSKTKTPTPVKRTNSTNTTPRAAHSPISSTLGSSLDQRRLVEKTAEAVQKPTSQSTESPPTPAPEDIAKSTTLAPLTSPLNTTSAKLPDYAGSDTTSDTPTGLIDNAIFTPSETVSGSAGGPGAPSRTTSETLKEANSEADDKTSSARRSIDTLPQSPEDPVHEEIEGSEKPSKPTDSSENRQRETEGAPTPTDIEEAIKSPTDIADYFADSGNQEMSKFVQALVSNASQSDAARKVDNAVSDSKEPLPDTLKELPTDDTLVSEPSNRTKEALGDVMKSTSSANPIEAVRNSTDKEQVSNVVNKRPDLPDPPAVPKKAEGAPANVERTASRGPTASPEAEEDDTQSFDNMGKPARIERSIEIPFQRPPRRQSIVHSPPAPSKPEFGNIANSLGNVEDLPSTENLPSTDDLPVIPEDPPEEILDPSVHSPSANVSPISKIPKITPIGMSPPPNLAQLGRGLGGKTVDDVGSIVDESGNVLGHAMGDLPAMVGKNVAENGEVYGDEGELIGYVTENFTESPSTGNPGGPWGGLQIDHDGNILDSTGNVIGRFFHKPGEKGQFPPSAGNSQQDSEPGQNPKQEEKPKVNAHTGGSPSDIFLDVKSTTDGIQLTIRIPTTFGQQRQESS